MVPFEQIEQFKKKNKINLIKWKKITKEDTKIKGKLEFSYTFFK